MILPGITHFGFFCMAVLLLNAMPGPDTAFIVGRSLTQGRLAGLISAVGISVGACLHTLALAFGLSAIVAASATAFAVIKLVGGLYLVYLGLRLLLASATVSAREQRRQPRPLAVVFRQAILTNLLNPKVVLFFLSFFPQFVAPTAVNKTMPLLFLGCVFVLMSTVWNCGTALLTGLLAQRASPNGRLKRGVEYLVGSAFIGFGVRLTLVEH
jgi:threonine/homoserine/homoserine lactone efflux protein